MRQTIRPDLSYRTYTPSQPGPSQEAVPDPSPKRRGHKGAWLVALVLVIGLFLIGDSLVHKHLQAAAAKQALISKPAAPAPLSTGPMASQINSVIAAHPELEIGVSVVDVKTGQHYVYGVTNPFEAASVGKLITACDFLKTVEQGQNSLTDPVDGSTAQDELQKMIVNSDNDAWHAFNDDVLGHTALQNYANQIGFINYDATANTMTPDDIGLLLQKLYTHQLLNTSHTNLLLSYMRNASEDSYIPAAVPSGAKVYHKAGWLDDRIHDAAIIDNGQRPYVLVIFTKQADGSQYDAQDGQQVFHSIVQTTTPVFKS